MNQNKDKDWTSKGELSLYELETPTLTQEQAVSIIENNKEEAHAILDDPNKFEEFMRSLEEKMKSLPIGGNILSRIPVFAEMLSAHFTKKYNEIPIGTLTAIIGALIYVILPVDIIPDFIPGIGHLDDATVVGACLVLVNSDVEKFLKWRDGFAEHIDFQPAEQNNETIYTDYSDATETDEETV